jgi:hypothetical protein
MRKPGWLSVFCLWPVAALAQDTTSAYTAWDLEKTCIQVEKGDDMTFAGSWSCPGQGAVKMLVSISDDRSFVGFGRYPARSCAYAKTFFGLNTALSPVEWRLKRGRPIAAIQRWRVVTDENGNTATWLVVTAIKGSDACPVHYIAGSYPNANELARSYADDIAEDFDCEFDVPTVDSKVGPPGVEFVSCREMRQE